MKDRNSDRVPQKANEFPVSFPVDVQIRDDEEIHIKDYFRVLLKRKWMIITFFLVVVSSVLIGTFMITPVYKATVTIKIDKEAPTIVKFKDVYDIERTDEAYLQTQYKILMSNNMAKRVIRAMELDQNTEFARNIVKPAAEPVEVSLHSAEDNIPQELVDAYQKRLKIEPVGKSQLVMVSFESIDPKLASAVANKVAETYLEYNIESKYVASQYARNWLEKQIQEMKAKVERAEEDLNRYASAKGIIFIGGRSSEESKGAGKQELITNELAQISAHLVQATSERITRESLYTESLQGDTHSLPAVLNNPLIQALKKDYATVEAEYSQLSTVYKPDYPKMVLVRERMEKLKSRIDTEIDKIASGKKRDYEAALKREKHLISTLEKYKSDALKVNEKMVQYEILKREAETNRELYNGLLQRLKEIGVSATLTASTIEVLDRAEQPKQPHKPKKSLNLLLAIFVGMFGGVGLAFFFEYLDNTVKTPDDVEKGMSLPSLGLVPYSKDLSDNKSLLGTDQKRSHLYEAYMSIGTYIQFSSPVKPPKTILITSPVPQSGKTTTAVNTALALTSFYDKVIIIDADLRKPRLHNIFDVDNSKGLTSFLTGNAEGIGDIIQDTKVANLDIITSGIIPPAPSELLGSSKMQELLDILSSQYSSIIIDSPPVLGMSDSLVLSTLTDGVIIVIKGGDTSKEAAIKTKKLLQGVNAKIFGVVLNGLTEADLKYGASYYSYYSYYYEEDGAGRKKKSTGSGESRE